MLIDSAEVLRVLKASRSTVDETWHGDKNEKHNDSGRDRLSYDYFDMFAKRMRDWCSRACIYLPNLYFLFWLLMSRPLDQNAFTPEGRRLLRVRYALDMDEPLEVCLLRMAMLLSRRYDCKDTASQCADSSDLLQLLAIIEGTEYNAVADLCAVCKLHATRSVLTADILKRYSEPSAYLHFMSWLNKPLSGVSRCTCYSNQMYFNKYYRLISDCEYDHTECYNYGTKCLLQDDNICHMKRSPSCENVGYWVSNASAESNINTLCNHNEEAASTNTNNEDNKCENDVMCHMSTEYHTQKFNFINQATEWMFGQGALKRHHLSAFSTPNQQKLNFNTLVLIYEALARGYLLLSSNYNDVDLDAPTHSRNACCIIRLSHYNCREILYQLEYVKHLMTKGTGVGIDMSSVPRTPKPDSVIKNTFAEVVSFLDNNVSIVHRRSKCAIYLPVYADTMPDLLKFKCKSSLIPLNSVYGALIVDNLFWRKANNEMVATTTTVDDNCGNKSRDNDSSDPMLVPYQTICSNKWWYLFDTSSSTLYSETDELYELRKRYVKAAATIAQNAVSIGSTVPATNVAQHNLPLRPKTEQSCRTSFLPMNQIRKPTQISELYACEWTFEFAYAHLVLGGGYTRRVLARQALQQIVNSVCTTGSPYIVWANNINVFNNLRRYGAITTLNLCSEICNYTPTLSFCTLITVNAGVFNTTRWNYENDETAGANDDGLEEYIDDQRGSRANEDDNEKRRTLCRYPYMVDHDFMVALWDYVRSCVGDDVSLRNDLRLCEGICTAASTFNAVSTDDQNNSIETQLIRDECIRQYAYVVGFLACDALNRYIGRNGRFDDATSNNDDNSCQQDGVGLRNTLTKLCLDYDVLSRDRQIGVNLCGVFDGACLNDYVSYEACSDTVRDQFESFAGLTAELLYKGAIRASCYVHQKHGIVCAYWPNSEFARGRFQFHLRDRDYDNKTCWSHLALCATRGMANSMITSGAPTSTASKLVGVCESVTRPISAIITTTNLAGVSQFVCRGVRYLAQLHQHEILHFEAHNDIATQLGGYMATARFIDHAHSIKAHINPTYDDMLALIRLSKLLDFKVACYYPSFRHVSQSLNVVTKTQHQQMRGCTRKLSTAATPPISGDILDIATIIADAEGNLAQGCDLCAL